MYIKAYRRAKMLTCLFLTVFNKIIPDANIPTFQEIGGETQPLIFCRRHTIFSWYRFRHHKSDWFLLSMYSYSFVCHCFN